MIEVAELSGLARTIAAPEGEQEQLERAWTATWSNRQIDSDSENAVVLRDLDPRREPIPSPSPGDTIGANPRSRRHPMSPINIEVTARGEVSDHAREQAREKLSDLESFVKGPILRARAVLIQEPNARIPTPARAEAEVGLQGRVIPARAAALSMEAAVDDVAERLQRQLSQVRRPPPHPAAQTRPVTARRMVASLVVPTTADHRAATEEREIMRRKSFAFGPMSVDEAADALEDLDHDFFLFHDAETDADAVVYWRDDGLLALIEPRWAVSADDRGPVSERSRFSSPIDLRTAAAEMDALDHRFVFFEDATTGRGNVIYKRYDGHYGLIEPA